MHVVTHLLTGWAVANISNLGHRDRAAVTLAGAAPDLDGLGIVAELATRQTDQPLFWWSEYHHVLGHNLAFGVAASLVVAAVAGKRLKAAMLAFLAHHLHLLGDLVGSRGPDGYDWPIPYLTPFDPSFQLTWSGQWALNAWPNVALTCLLLVLTFYLAWSRGYSVIGIVSARVDGVFVETLRRRFGWPEQGRGA
jgi:hypothetical protein